MVCSRSGGQQQRARSDACLSHRRGHRIRARCPAASRTTSASAKPDVRSSPNCPIAPPLLPPCPTCAYDVAARCSLKVDRFATATHAAGGRPRARREVATRRPHTTPGDKLRACPCAAGGWPCASPRTRAIGAARAPPCTHAGGAARMPPPMRDHLAPPGAARLVPRGPNPTLLCLTEQAEDKHG